VLDDEEIRVEQPRAGWRNVDAARTRIEQDLARIRQHAFRLGESRQEQAMSGAARGAGALFCEIVPVGELSCVLCKPGVAIRLAHLPWCRFLHLAVSLDVSAVARLVGVARRAIPVESRPLFVAKHVAYSREHEIV
jgi:hypothetical protein